MPHAMPKRFEYRDTFPDTDFLEVQCLIRCRNGNELCVRLHPNDATKVIVTLKDRDAVSSPSEIPRHSLMDFIECFDGT